MLNAKRSTVMKNRLFGSRMERMPGIAFVIMGWMFAVRDRIKDPSRLLDRFSIARGQCVVDYGCGTGSYLKRASELVGSEGRVYAADVHEMAIHAVEKRIRKQHLENVTGIIVRDGRCPLETNTADVIYALDMFHMVRDSDAFLNELYRISVRSALLYIDNGHQSRKEARSKITASGVWEITEENDRFMTCRPVISE